MVYTQGHGGYDGHEEETEGLQPLVLFNLRSLG